MKLDQIEDQQGNQHMEIKERENEETNTETSPYYGLHRTKGIPVNWWDQREDEVGSIQRLTGGGDLGRVFLKKIPQLYCGLLPKLEVRDGEPDLVFLDLLNLTKELVASPWMI